MKKTFIILSMVVMSVGMANCSSSKKASTDSSMNTTASTPSAKVAEVRKKYTEKQMEEGKTLWQNNCNKCHKLFEPETRTVEKWEGVLPRMVKRAHLTDEQAGMVRAYLISHAKLS